MMARAARVVLDMALVSLRKVKPAVSNVWDISKSAIASTPVRPLVMNPVVTFIENKMGTLSEIVETKIERFRNKQFDGELKYLEKEVEKVKKKMKESSDGCTCKFIRPVAGFAWQYGKVEMVPPMTQAFFRGPAGTALEMTVGGVADGIIASLQAVVNAMAAAEKQRIKNQEEKLKAAAEAAMQEAKRKAEKAQADAQKAKKEQDKNDAEAKKVAEAKEAAAAAAKPKEEKKVEKPKAEKPKEEPKKPEPKK